MGKNDAANKTEKICSRIQTWPHVGGRPMCLLQGLVKT